MTSRSPSLLVSDPGGIRAIAQRISVWRIERRALNVRFPALDDEANDAVRRRISVHYGACGCHQGRVAGFWTLAIFVLLVVTGVVSIRALSIGRLVLIYFAISFVTMFIAKIIGLCRARRSLYRLADELDSSLHATKVAHG